MFDDASVASSSDSVAAGPVRWSERTPSAALVGVLERPPSPGTGSFERLERIGAFERSIAWLQARQAGEMASFVADAEQEMATFLAEHDPGRDGPVGPFDTVGAAGQSAASEIQLMLHSTAAAMFDRLDRARKLQDPAFAPTAQLARAGLLTEPKLRKILDGAIELEPEQLAQLQEQVLPTAPGQTTGQLGASVQKVLTGLSDADVPARRREKKARGRSATIQPEPDGMATLRLFLPAAAATGVYAVLDEHARRCGTADARTMDERRADVLVDLILRRTGLMSAGSGGGSSESGTDAGANTNTSSGSRAVPGVVPAPAEGSPTVRDAVTIRINVTVPLDSLLGSSDEPAELAGHGPIPASDARALAFDPTSTWYRLLTDPVTGRVVERGRTGYRPPAAVADLVRARHPRCEFPACRVPAHRCDLDHVVPHGPVHHGETCEENLCPFCRSHHRLKHSPGWSVELRDDDSVVWTTPSGHTYTAEPGPVGPVRATNAVGRRGPGIVALLRDPGLAERLGEVTAEPPF
ncbi:HNH endonuclease [Pseudonocardia phyllosphaerae]|uniref:HNH endonuclease n=1 Tax=Pseudonocardia phyllosphaerae TaxID=3390502 RepID=UPI003979A0BC